MYNLLWIVIAIVARFYRFLFSIESIILLLESMESISVVFNK